LSGPTQASAGAQATLKEPAKKAKAPGDADALQRALFELPAAEIAQQMQTKPLDSDWIAGLLVSSVFVSQKQWVARAAVKDDEIRALLEALSERGGKIVKGSIGRATVDAVDAGIRFRQCGTPLVECRSGAGDHAG
jgi:hypothetical protein